MNERWRKPANLVAVNEDVGVIYRDQAGNMRKRDQYVFDAETAERIKQGYMCVHCYEPFETPFPERCPTCQFPVRRDQADVVARMYGGGLDLSPELSHEEIIERDLGNKGMPDIWLPDTARRN